MPISSPSATLGAEMAGFQILGVDFEDFLPQLDTVFEVDVSLAEVSDLPYTGPTQVSCKCWACLLLHKVTSS